MDGLDTVEHGSMVMATDIFFDWTGMDEVTKGHTLFIDTWGWAG